MLKVRFKMTESSRAGYVANDEYRRHENGAPVLMETSELPRLNSGQDDGDKADAYRESFRNL